MAIREQLAQMKEETNNGLVEYVIDSILDRSTEEDDTVSYMEDVLQHGCVSGIVSSLIYYVDTHQFYDNYYNEIEDLRLDYLEQGINFFESVADGDLKNTMAWIAYEETLRRVADELEVAV
jgi:hypothetical protein